MDTTSPEAIEHVEAILERKLSSVLQSADLSTAGGVQALVDILNRSDRGTERLILEGLEYEDVELADEVRQLMFVFEDIDQLDDRSVQLVLRQVDAKDLAIALKGVRADVRDKILRNMSERAAAEPRRGDRPARAGPHQGGRGGPGRRRPRHPRAGGGRPDRR